jgi:cathepsin B
MKYHENVSLCTYRCDDGTSTGNDRYYCKIGSMAIATTQEEIMKELYKNGPMMVGLVIYEDFMNYGGGIYKHVEGEEIGGHAMKLLGYGHDEKEGLYWELQNQWSDDWGEKGYIKVKAGEIGIDSVAVACMPDLI